MKNTDSGSTLVLFDGVCNLCSGFVRFIVPRDPSGHFRFASLQSERGKKILREYGLESNYLDSIVLIESKIIYTKSCAALRIAKKLNGLWKILFLLVAVPKFIRDPVYDYVAKKRYGWFGRTEQCLIPDSTINSRFLTEP
jgi:predicted DCC family thiol-disulfide oxidoreductase YuxK